MIAHHSSHALQRLLVAVAGVLFSGAGVAEEAIPGNGDDALPAMARVGTVGIPGAARAASATAGYGWTESLGKVAGSHHRVQGTVAGAVAPLDWLALALSLQGHYDLHPRDSQGHDDSATGIPRLAVRTRVQLSRDLALGTELVGWFWGGDAPSLEPDAASFEFRLLASWWHPGKRTLLGALAGWRLDRSAASVSDPERLRPGDRLALGVSDYNAALVGFGIMYLDHQREYFGEFTGDWLLGQGAPPVANSPWRVTIGLRQHVIRALAWEVRAEGLVSSRPGLNAQDPLVPIEPRILLLTGLRYQWREESPLAAMVLPTEPRGSTTKAPASGITKASESMVPEAASLRGRVTDQTGKVVANAHVVLVLRDQTLEANADANGAFAWQEVPGGTAELQVAAPSYVSWRHPVTLSHDTVVEIQLESALPAGQLRGLIRSYAGEPVHAYIQVEPGGARANTDQAGRFELDLAPGTYRVSVEAAGYRTQKRSVLVEDQGVTVINAELEVRR